ncbi:hypothetical protein FRC12_007986 [Ceratobasidium sp. 428]|nr:hypothetical protein FRC09_015002 [Ceratobasidium sp. 395]KAG8791847.1 hypothetical protein FRC12_007986 [Ceratobasidium sp. 428]
MVSSIRSLFVIALAGLALAVPTPLKTSLIEKRTISGLTAATCSKISFTPDQIDAAASEAEKHIAARTDVGNNNYPHVFNNRERFTFNEGCNKPFFEFPIFQDKVYTGGPPGADRVIVGSVDGGDAAFCGVITHTDAPTRNGFVQCDSA